MITYELALALKDAGFPQISKINPKYGLYGIGSVGGVDMPFAPAEVLRTQGIKEELVYCPTLSELIEACGDNFSHLLRVYINNELKWVAIQPGDNINVLPFSIKEFYNSPEEAVAKLYLELNKNKNA